MKILGIDRLRDGFDRKRDVPPLLEEELRTLWRMYADGAVREMYQRADEPGAVLVLECADVEEARRLTAEFPMSRAGLLEWNFVPLEPFGQLGVLFEDRANAASPAAT